MNNIDEILNDYFEGKSSLEQEKIARQYFLEGEVKPEHEIYKALFAALAREKTIKAPIVNFPGAEHKKAPRTRRILFISFSGIAAVLLLLFALRPLQSPREQNPTVVIINGQKITDPLLAREYAGMKFAEAEAAIRRCYTPFHEAEKTSRELNADNFFEKAEENIQ